MPQQKMRSGMTKGRQCTGGLQAGRGRKGGEEGGDQGDSGLNLGGHGGIKRATEEVLRECRVAEMHGCDREHPSSDRNPPKRWLSFNLAYQGQ